MRVFHVVNVFFSNSVMHASVARRSCRSSACLLLDEFVALTVAVNYGFSTFAGADFACGSQQFRLGFPSNGPGFKDGGSDG